MPIGRNVAGIPGSHRRAPAALSAGPDRPRRQRRHGVSSEELAAGAGVTSAKVRKDLSQLGSYGTRGVGYEVDCLCDEISRELGLTQHRAVALVGVGNLGHALAGYGGFAARGFRIAGLFDADPRRVGELVAGLRVRPMDELEQVVASEQVSIGVIATPAVRRPAGLRPAGRLRRDQHPELRPRRAVRAGRRRRPQGRPAVELQILSFHETRKSRARRDRRSTASCGGRSHEPARVGLNHRTASPELLERTAVTPEDVPKLLHDLLAGEHVTEAVVLTTCNRVEVYAETATFHGGVTEVGDLLARAAGLPFEELHRSLYVHHEARAVQHLFSVACGLDSMLVGEAQILGQVRQAYKIARDEGSAGRGLSELLREALRVGKRAHTETGIDTAAASLVGVGLRVAGEALPDAARAPIERPARRSPRGARSAPDPRVRSPAACCAGPASGSSSSPTARRSARGGSPPSSTGAAIGLDALDSELREADLVVTATGATLPVITADAVQRAMAATRAGRALVLLDLGLPRDVDPAARELPGVSLIDLEALRAALAGSDVVTDVDAVRALVAEEVAAYLDRQRALRVAPTVAALRARAAEMVASELDRLAGRLPELDRARARRGGSTVRRVVDKLLHAPTVRVKELAESPGGDRYAEALHELFELDPRKAQAVSAPGTRRAARPEPPDGPAPVTAALRVGTRRSALALAQSGEVAERCRRRWSGPVELVEVVTEGTGRRRRSASSAAPASS